MAERSLGVGQSEVGRQPARWPALLLLRGAAEAGGRPARCLHGAAEGGWQPARPRAGGSGRLAARPRRPFVSKDSSSRRSESDALSADGVRDGQKDPQSLALGLELWA
jgi:hypothetical protein